MKTLSLLAAVLALGLTLTVGDAEAAKRLGAGKSSGMQRAIAETERRRLKQIAFNAAHGIVPTGISKRITDIIDGVYEPENAQRDLKVAQQQANYQAMSEKQLARELRRLEKEMLEFARNLEFEKAAAARDELFRIRKQVFGISGVEPQALPS